MSLRWLSCFRCSGLLIAAGCLLTATYVGIHAVDLPGKRVIAGADAAIALALLFGAVAALVLGHKASRRSQTAKAVASTIVGLAAAMLTALWAIKPAAPVAQASAPVDCRISMARASSKSRHISDCTCTPSGTGNPSNLIASGCRAAKSRHAGRRR
jgi:hypothetical protein